MSTPRRERALEVAAAGGLGCEVVSYPGYGLGPIETTRHAARALRTALDGRTRLATETGTLPVALADGLDLVDVTDKLSLARAVKDGDELEISGLGRQRQTFRSA